MKHGVLAVLLLALAAVLGHASPPANVCPSPCDACGPDGTLSPPCGGEEPARITLREWCRQLRILPVPLSTRPGDEADLYDLFSSGGVCP